jgi:glycosyltransferase involved in cell wall biosynthesis
LQGTIIKNPNLYNSAKPNTAKNIKRIFSWKKCANETVGIYAQLVKK